MKDIYATFAAAYIVAALVSSKRLEPIRTWAKQYTGVLECAFCTSLYVGFLAAYYVSSENMFLRGFAIAAGSNVIILLIHLNMLTTPGSECSEDGESEEL